MLGDSSSSVLGSSSGDAAAAINTATVTAHEGGGGGGGGSNSGEDERMRGDEGDRSFGGNRWPRQETLALLKIRSDMDVAFRDASVKGPLWDEVSRKLAELGFHRNAKKCKEKFENVYKYHKRTKEGRTGKSDGKTYRFFDQLQALENQPSPFSSPLPVPVSPVQSKAEPAITPTIVHQNSTVPSISTTSSTPPMTLPFPSSFSQLPTTNPKILPPTTNPPINPPPVPPTASQPPAFPPSIPSSSLDLMSNSTSSSTSDEEIEGSRKRKRKWKDFFQRLMHEVIERQDELQKKFLEAIEKREQERFAREEAWRMQEMARVNREREILAQERSIASAKDQAVMAFLQKISEQQGQTPVQPPQNINLPPPQPPPPPPVQSTPIPPPPQPAPPPQQSQIVLQQHPRPQPPPPPPPQTNLDIKKLENSEDNLLPASPSRWPKVEVHALIKLRTNLDSKYQENVPKGPLWEEISAQMKRLGYNRSSKRCKEKWENINKYFKKVKESNKRRPEDSKTCPYFHQLDALYRERNKFDQSSNKDNSQALQMNSVPLMVRPEQQWPPQQHDSGMDDMEGESNHDEDEEDDEDEDGGNYELVANKPSSVSATG
ncbi:hypothetical protein UlMin_036324 [Ulmus minor]